MLQGKPQVSFESRRCMSAVGRCADHVLLNKTDLLKEGQLEELRPIVASLNPFATVRHRLPGTQPAHVTCHVPPPPLVPAYTTSRQIVLTDF